MSTINVSRGEKKSAGDVYVYIDNSNLWIQGQKTYAERYRHEREQKNRENGDQAISRNPDQTTHSKLQVISEPLWRVRAQKLKTVLLRESGLLPEQREYDVYWKLYGSTPPPVDTIWEAFRKEEFKVNTFKRSPWTKKEKQVDSNLNVDCTRQSTLANAYKIPTVFIIVSGDRDLWDAVREIATTDGLPVHVWSWRNDLAKIYSSPVENITIHHFDPYLDEIGFIQGEFDPERHTIDPYSIVVRDPLRKAEALHQLVKGLHIPVYQYELKEKPSKEGTSNSLVIIPANAVNMSYEEKEDLFIFIQKALKKENLQVISYTEYYETARERRTQFKLEVSNKFRELDGMTIDDDQNDRGDDSDDSGDVPGPIKIDNQPPREVHENLDEREAESSFIENRYFTDRRQHQIRREETKSRLRCYWRIYCERNVQCQFAHTITEKDHFKTYGNKKASKHKICLKGKECSWNGCRYAHGNEELFCPTCGLNGHAMERCPERKRSL